MLTAEHNVFSYLYMCNTLQYRANATAMCHCPLTSTPPCKSVPENTGKGEL